MPKKIVAGNWKMNLTLKEARTLTKKIVKHQIENKPPCEVVLCVPSIYLEKGINWSYGTAIKIGAQDCSSHEKGAYTGEVAANMIRSVGATHVIIGHSERREYHKEDSPLLVQKIKLALNNELTPIFCCGEPLEVRQENNQEQYVAGQIEEVLGNLNPEDSKKLIIAYEPIWAIGTGETASPEQAQQMHAMIRDLVSNLVSEDYGKEVSILYGGSVKPENAKELFSKPDIDGGLVGGASLDADGFISIIESA